MLSEALSTARAIDDAVRAAEVELELAEVAEEEGHSAEAMQQVRAGLTSLHGNKDPDDEIAAEILLAKISLAEGKTTDAIPLMDAARALFSQSPDWEGHVIFGITNGRVQAATGRLAEARESLKTVITETTKHNTCATNWRPASRCVNWRPRLIQPLPAPTLALSRKRPHPKVSD